jgi:general secretion pathway protein J
MECWRNGVLEKWHNSRRDQYPSTPILQYSKGYSGFTLIEILIAIMIFATLITTIYASYTGTFRVIDETESQAEIYRMARIVMDRMLEDLESVYIQKRDGNVSSEGDSGSSFQFLGEERDIMGRRADMLRFISRAHTDFSGQNPSYGAARIEYFVRERNDGEDFVLYRNDTPLFAETYHRNEESDGLVLCEGLASLAFTYYGEDGGIFNSWDSTAEGMDHKIPKMVSISLEFQNTVNPELPIQFTTSVALPAEQEYL